MLAILINRMCETYIHFLFWLVKVFILKKNLWHLWMGVSKLFSAPLSTWVPVKSNRFEMKISALLKVCEPAASGKDSVESEW